MFAVPVPFTSVTGVIESAVPGSVVTCRLIVVFGIFCVVITIGMLPVLLMVTSGTVYAAVGFAGTGVPLILTTVTVGRFVGSGTFTRGPINGAGADRTKRVLKAVRTDPNPTCGAGFRSQVAHGVSTAVRCQVSGCLAVIIGECYEWRLQVDRSP